MKWVLLILFIGCGVNALGLAKGDDLDDLDDENNYYSNLTTEKDEMTKEERIKWGIATLVFFVLFLVFAF